MAGEVVLPNRSKRVKAFKAFIDTAIIVLNVLVAILELIRTFLK
ncbi:damage-inducible type I toxin DinQ [Xenorhabdus lircayensis]